MAYWPFEGNVNDASGNGHHGILRSGGMTTRDRFGVAHRAYTLWAGNYIEVKGHPDLFIQAGNGFSISGWISLHCANDGSNATALINSGGNTTDHYGLSPGGFRFGNSSLHLGLTPPSPAPFDLDSVSRWHHLVVVVSDTIKTPPLQSQRWFGMYIDNQLVDSDQTPVVTSIGFINPILGLTGDRTSIDDIRIYQRPLSSADVAALYGEGGWPGTEVPIDSALAVPRISVDSLTPLTICLGESVHFAVRGDVDALVWNTTEGLENTDTGMVTATPSRSVVYKVYGINHDPDGICSKVGNIDSIRVTVFVPPKVNSLITMRACPSDLLTLGGTTSEGRMPYRWEWTPAEGLDNPAAEHPRLIASRSGQFRVVVTDANGCRDTGIVRITVDSVPEIDIGADTLYFCLGTEGAELRANMAVGSGSYSYLWSPADGLNRADSARVIASPQVTTSYVVRVENDLGCFRLDSVVVVPTEKPITANAGADTTICIGQTLRIGFEAPLPGLLYQWSPATGLDDPASAQPIARPQSTTTYRLTVSDPKTGCFSSDEINITMRALSLRVDPPIVEFEGKIRCEAESVDTVIVISNDGTEEGTVGRELVGTPYSVVDPALPTTVPAGSSLAIHLRYAPGGPGNFLDELRFPFRVGECLDTIRVGLSGKVDDVRLDAAMTSLDFGQLDGCTAERDTTILLTTTSAHNLTITGVLLPDGFRLLDALPIEVPAGGSVAVRVRYVPTGPGINSGGLTFSYEPCAGTLQLDLYGEKQGVTFTMVDTLNFGLIGLCAEGYADLPLEILYKGEGSGEGAIVSVETSGPFTTDATAGTVLPEGVAASFRVRFAPTDEGKTAGKLRLRLEPCGVEREVVMLGEAVKPELTGRAIDFGVVGLGLRRNGEVIFQNTGNGIVRVERIKGLVPPFSLVGTIPALPANLGPGESLRVEIEYEGSRGKWLNSAIAEVSAPCATEFSAEVRGEGGSKGRAKIVLPVVASEAGEKARLSILLEESSGLDEVGAQKYRARISFDRSLLIIADGHPWQDDPATGRRVVELSGDRGGLTEGEIGGVDVIGTLGRSEQTDLHLESFVWEDASGVEIDTVHGEYRLSGLCRDGGVRLYDPEGEVGIKSVSPNPGGDFVEIEYSLAEGGVSRMALVDELGRNVKTIFAGQLPAGLYRVDADVRFIESGGYWLVLETPTVRLSRRLLIVR